MNTKSAKRIGGAASLVIAAMLGAAGPAPAQDIVSGAIIIAAADPNDFVVELDKAGRCGSRFFHSQRVNVNFRESVAMFLTAFAASKNVVVFVTGCAGDRNIISHGFAVR
jgi:hypothetical protein